MRNHDIYQQIAHLHATNIDQGFLSSLGIPFLRLLYESIDANEASVLLTALDEGRVVGFVAGAVGMGSIYRELVRRWPRLFVALLPAMASPKKVWRIMETLLVGKKTHLLTDLPPAELLSIAVDPAHRHHGHAQGLYVDLVRQFQVRGVDRFKIVVGESLMGAHRFYRKMGAKPAGQIEVHRGQASVVYVHQLSRHPEAAES